MIIYENNCLFINLEEEQEKDSMDIPKDSMDLPVWAVQDTISNPTACQKPHSAQLDPLSFIVSPPPPPPQLSPLYLKDIFRKLF